MKDRAKGWLEWCSYHPIYVIPVFVVILLAVVYVIVPAGHVYHVKITRTSPNTWHIEDPNNHPGRYVSRTCAVDGLKVSSLTTNGNAYDQMDVVCR